MKFDSMNTIMQILITYKQEIIMSKASQKKDYE